MVQKFKRQLLELGINLNDKQEQMFGTYFDLLFAWSEKMNLTSIIKKEDVYEKHFLDSLALCKALDLKSLNEAAKPARVLDIGSGAGFPGLPLKIVFPNLEIHLLDSLSKRVQFLNHVIMELGLNEIYAHHGRAEDFAKVETYRESFDLVVSRAVSSLSVLSEYSLPFLKRGGKFIPYKSGAVQSEVDGADYAIDTLGGRLEDVVYLELPETEIKRSFVILEKVGVTPEKYPRKAGKVEKKPLAK